MHSCISHRLTVIGFFVVSFSTSTEFLALMKKVAESPLVMHVIQITEVLEKLEKLSNQLSKIQKELGVYLERERTSFPR